MKLFQTFLVTLLTIFSYAQPAGYSYGKLISINDSEVSGLTDFTDFTILFNTTDLDLRSVSNGGHVESENGYDIIFTLGDCATVLNHQIEKYNPITGEVVFWVKIPSLSASTNTNFHIYYGNSSVTLDPSTYITWNTNYEGIWHMNNDPSTTLLLDYSGDGIDGESHGSMTSVDLVSGKIGDAIEFDGSNDYFSLAAKNYNTLGAIPQMTVSAWVKTGFSGGSNFSNWSILDFDRSEYYNLFISGNGRLCYATSRGPINDSYAGTSGDLNDDSWHHVAAVYDGTDKLLYIDGALSLTVSNPHSGNAIGDGTTRYGFIGEGSEATSYNGSRNNIYYDGMYDEIRFTTDILSTDWITTEFNNQNSPTTFYTIGAEMAASDLCILLPIELLNFTAIQYEKTIKLSWATLSEQNNAFFTIEHSINPKLNWQSKIKIEGAGNSTVQLNYETYDLQPQIGLNYYRIKQTDFDGGIEYFATQSVLYKPVEKTLIFPNPAKDWLTISGSTGISEDQIRIFDLTGREVTALITIEKGIQKKLKVNLTRLNSGIYLLHLSNEVIRFKKD